MLKWKVDITYLMVYLIGMRIFSMYVGTTERPYLLRGFHNPPGSPHLSPEAVWVTESLVSTVEVEAVDQSCNNTEPRHVLLQVVRLLGYVEEGTLRLRLVVLVDLVKTLVLRGVSLRQVPMVRCVRG